MSPLLAPNARTMNTKLKFPFTNHQCSCHPFWLLMLEHWTPSWSVLLQIVSVPVTPFDSEHLNTEQQTESFLYRLPVTCLPLLAPNTWTLNTKLECPFTNCQCSCHPFWLQTLEHWSPNQVIFYRLPVTCLPLLALNAWILNTKLKCPYKSSVFLSPLLTLNA